MFCDCVFISSPEALLRNLSEARTRPSISDFRLNNDAFFVSIWWSIPRTVRRSSIQSRRHSGMNACAMVMPESSNASRRFCMISGVAIVRILLYPVATFIPAHRTLLVGMCFFQKMVMSNFSIRNIRYY